MQPLNWEHAARTPLSESFNIYAAVDAVRPATESFGDHLYRSNSTPLPPPPAPPREAIKPAVSAPPPSPQAPAQDNRTPDVNTNSYSPASAKNESVKDSSPMSERSPESSDSSAVHSMEPKSSSADQDRQSKQPVADSADTKSAQSSRNRPNARRLAAEFQQSVESADPTTSAEMKANTKRVKTAASKTKPSGKNKHAGDSSDSPDPIQDAAPIPDHPQAASVSLDQQVSEDGSKISGKGSGESKQANPQQAGGEQATSALVESLPIEPVESPVGTSEAMPSNASKRGQRGVREAVGADAITSTNTAPIAAPAPNELVIPLNEAAALLDSAETNTGIDTGKGLQSLNSTSSVSTPSSPQMRFAQHLAGKTSTREVKNSPLTDMEHARLVDRVARAFQTAEAKGGNVTLRLHPPELGSLRVELRVTDGVLSARLEAETPTARTVLLDNVQMLHDRLAEQGVRIERFDVDLLDHRSPDNSAGFEQNGTREQNQRQQPTTTRPLDLQDNDPTQPSPRPIASGNLNVII